MSSVLNQLAAGSAEDNFADAFIIDRTPNEDVNIDDDAADDDDDEKEGASANLCTNHRKRPAADKEAKHAKKLIRMHHRFRQALKEQQEAMGENTVTQDNFIPPISFGSANPSKRPYDGEWLPEPTLNIRAPRVHADSFVTQVTNALLAVETTAKTFQAQQVESTSPPHQQHQFDRAGLDVLLLLHRLQRLPPQRTAFHELLVHFWTTPSWQALLPSTMETTCTKIGVPAVPAVDLLDSLLMDNFLIPGRFCIVHEKKNRYQSRIRWNPQWVQHILLPKREEIATAGTTSTTTARAAAGERATSGTATTTATGVGSLTTTSPAATISTATSELLGPFPTACVQALVAQLEDSPGQLPPNHSALVDFLQARCPDHMAAAAAQQGHRTAEDIVQNDLVNAVLLPEQLLNVVYTSSSYHWNLPLWHALLRGRATTIMDWPSHLMDCCFLARSFPANRLDFQRKLGVVRSVAGIASDTDSNEMTLLRHWIHQRCLKVAPHGAFTWNMTRLYELHHPPQSAAAPLLAASSDTHLAVQRAAVAGLPRHL